MTPRYEEEERALIRSRRLFDIMVNGVSAYSGTGAY